MAASEGAEFGTHPGDYWVVEVKDKGDTLKGIKPYTKRHEFRGEGAAMRAWTCWAAAKKHGFEADATQARDHKVRAAAEAESSE